MISDEAIATSSDYSVDTQFSLENASVAGNQIVLTFDATINALSTPSLQSFDIQVDGATRNVTAISFSGNTATLTIDGKAVVDTDSVEFSYSQLGSAGFESTAGAVVANNNIEAVFGTTGNNAISGTSASEYVFGGSGNDTITGGAGNDILTGGAGSDTFDYNNTTDGSDTITDFTVGSGGDSLDLRDLLDYASGDTLADYIELTNDGTDVTLKIDKDGGGDEFTSPDVTITLQGINDAAVTLASLETDNLAVL